MTFSFVSPISEERKGEYNQQKEVRDMHTTINLQEIFIANLMSLTLLITTVISINWRMKTFSRQSLPIYTMIIACVTCSIVDPMVFYFDGKPGMLARMIVINCNSWLYLMNMVIGAAWLSFLVCYLGVRISKIHLYVLIILMLGGALLLIVNVFCPVVFTVSADNVYIRGPLYFYYVYMEFVLMGDGTIIHFLAKKKGGMLKTFPVLLFIVPVAIGTLIQSCYYGVSSIWPFVSVSICAMLFCTQNDLLYRDKLTGLYNRFYLDSKKESFSRNETEFTLMILDLNHFKAINDRYGYAVGDKALVETAECLKSTVSDRGEIIRYAGDEFVILLYIDDDAEIRSIIDTIHRKLEHLTIKGEKRYSLSASIGYTKCTGRSQTLEDMMNLTDKRMFEMKQQYYSNHPFADRRNRSDDNIWNASNEDAAAMIEKLEKDPVTGAYNDVFFLEYVDRRLETDVGIDYDMVCLEVESYELLYGRYGLEFCNLFMKSLAENLREYLPEEALIGLMEQDQIGIFLRHIPFSRHERMFHECAEKANAQIAPKLLLKYGIYSSVNRRLSAEEIYQNACRVLDEIRHDNQTMIAEFDNALLAKVLTEKKLMTDKERAIDEKQFRVYYQPKYLMPSGVIGGAEALARWEHPEMGLLGPGMFIPLFEKNGFVSKLDKYIVEEVCRQLRSWMDEGKKVVPVSVNISQADFDQVGLSDTLEKLVDSYDVPHELIHFEITESTNAIDEYKKMVVVESLRDKGFVVELDDFGTGYSTITALGELPVDVIKLDRSLIERFEDQKFRTILDSALFAAGGLKMAVVAEGVEKKEQRDYLVTLCRSQVELYIQGFFYSSPVSAEEFEKMLRD